MEYGLEPHTVLTEHGIWTGAQHCSMEYGLEPHTVLTLSCCLVFITCLVVRRLELCQQQQKSVITVLSVRDMTLHG